MSDYHEELADAIADIEEAGRIVTLIKTGVTSFNPTNSALTPAADVNTSVHAVFTAYSAKDIDGEIIRHGDKKCLVAGPVDADWLMDGANRYSIVDIQAVDPGDGGAILSKLQVRK